jgi:integrase/recombinase XerD
MADLTLTNFHFQDLLKGFSKRLRDQGKSISHYQSAIMHAEEFLWFLERMGVAHSRDITQHAVTRYFEYINSRPNLRREGGLSSAYINKHRQGVLRFLEFVFNTKTGESGFSVPHIKNLSTLKDILSREEITLLYQSTDNSPEGITNRAILSLLYGCGLRRGELHNLEVNDIDFHRSIIHIKKTKTKRERQVVMSSKVQDHIEEYVYSAREQLLQAGSTEPYFLISSRGERMSIHNIIFRVKKMAREAGVEKNITPHTFRHSIATHLLTEMSLEEVGDFLGHRSLDSTQIYTHIKEANR